MTSSIPLNRLFSLGAFSLIVMACNSHAAWLRHTIDDSSRGADGVRVGDLNRDGLMDLATGWEEGGIVRVYFNPGPTDSIRPWPAVTVGRVDSPEDAVFADVDNDGQLDVVSSCEGANRTVYVHWAPRAVADLRHPEAWITEPIPATATREMWMFCLPMDVDSRYGVDLVIGSKGDHASISWLEAPASHPRDLSRWKLHRVYDATWIMSLIPRDLNEDGHLDVLLSDRKPPGSGVKWLENPGPSFGTPNRWTPHLVGGTDEEVMFIDVLTTQEPQRFYVAAAVKPMQITIWEQDESEPWGQAGSHTVSESAGRAKALKIADLNLDGRPDAIFTCEGADAGRSGVIWIEHREDRTIVEHDISGPEGIKFDRVELLDLDADGDLDVITCEERDNLGVVWYENPAR